MILPAQVYWNAGPYLPKIGHQICQKLANFEHSKQTLKTVLASLEAKINQLLSLKFTFWAKIVSFSGNENNDYNRTVILQLVSRVYFVKFCETFVSTEVGIYFRIGIGLRNSASPKTCKTETIDRKLVTHCLSSKPVK